MKLIIAGGRTYSLSDTDFWRLDAINEEYGIAEVVSGDCKGADIGGQDWANLELITIKHMPADWDKYKKAAGPIRNAAMAKYADAVALFPGGRGTQSMFNEAKKAGIKIFNYR